MDSTTLEDPQHIHTTLRSTHTCFIDSLLPLHLLFSFSPPQTQAGCIRMEMEVGIGRTMGIEELGAKGTFWNIHLEWNFSLHTSK